ncbi:hypothetical protein BCR33DRAFT_853865 [Rhizoclosmatium globosum]|uniref:FPL domain-containing protein n=1 Tax=Rhizoclosmatium globosum TaxID=329046 RepID=A0A1Y2BW59_9FUNG|nr:hypothetical protein BCR33DRAFT_853865 [Rhizoclosmatium globosum]|eukprot:ORY38914.1 hypothetical protein BCR33DRAFT_853865 [Rhizoclosmatium globosum]
MDWLDPAFGAAMALLEATTTPTSATSPSFPPNPIIKRKEGIQIVRTSHTTLTTATALIASLHLDTIKANRKVPDAKRRKQWDAIASDTNAALNQLGQTLVECDSMDISDVFDVFFELKTHLVILTLIPASKSHLIPIIHQLTSSVLKFFNLLSENIEKDYILFLLFSNNYVNDLISLPGFGFRHSESLGPADGSDEGFNYFVTLLKNLSNKLNRNSINFFLNEHLEDFPLFTEALALFSSDERMVRIAARTVTLNIFKVNDKSALEFLENTVDAYTKLSRVWEKEVSAIEKSILLNNKSILPKLESDIDDCVDTLLYFEDVFALEIPNVCDGLVAALVNGPIQTLTNSLSSSDALETQSTSLFFLTQLFTHTTYTPLLDATTDLLFSTTIKPHILQSLNTKPLSPSSSTILPSDAPVSLCVALLASIVNNRYISVDVLKRCNICPRQTLKTRMLVDSLVAGTTTTPTGSLSGLSTLSSGVEGLKGEAGGSWYDEALVGCLIEVLGSTAGIRPVCLELTVWVLGMLVGVQAGKKGVLLDGECLDMLLKFHEKWRNMIVALVNDGVDLVVDLLEYETNQVVPLDVPRILQDTRLLIPRNSSTPKQPLSTSFANEVRDMSFLVRIWKLTSQCLVKLGIPDKYNTPTRIQKVEFDPNAKVINLDSFSTQPCIIQQDKHPQVNGYFVFDATTFLLTVPDPLAPGQANVTLSKPLQCVTAILSDTSPSTLEIHYQSLVFADTKKRGSMFFWGVNEVDTTLCGRMKQHGGM